MNDDAAISETQPPTVESPRRKRWRGRVRRRRWRKRLVIVVWVIMLVLAFFLTYFVAWCIDLF
jgi:hypothetical protein